MSGTFTSRRSRCHRDPTHAENTGSKARPFVKSDFRYVASKDSYICPAREIPARRMTTVDKGLTLHRYWTNACVGCRMLIIDEICYLPMERQQAHLMFQVVGKLYEHASIIMTSNLNFGSWDQALAENRREFIRPHAEMEIERPRRPSIYAPKKTY
jgi:IstB-like ATP binding protein